MALMRARSKRRSVSSWVSPAQADAALLALQVGPAAYQAGGHVFQLSQLDLQLALMGTGTLGKNVENQSRAIQHPALELPFQIALLGRAQAMVEDNQLGTVDPQCFTQLFHLAATDEGARVGPVPAAGKQHGRLGTGGTNELHELARILAFPLVLEVDMYQHCRFAGIGAFKKQSIPHTLLSGWAAGSCGGSRTLREGTTVEMACL